MSTFTIEMMKAEDLPTVVELENEAFATIFKKLLGAIPPGRPEGVRVANRFHRPDTVSIVLRDEQGVIQGVEYVKRMGRRGVVGPGAIRPNYQGRKAGTEVAAGVMTLAREQGSPLIDSVTFPTSPRHFNWHWQFGAVSVPALFVTREAKPPLARVRTGLVVEHFSSLSEVAQVQALGEMKQITERFTPGFHVTADVHHVLHRKLGETLLVREGGRLLGFAVLHYGEGSEAFMDEQLLVQLLFVSPGEAHGEDAFHMLMGRAEELALELKLSMVGAMALSSRRATREALDERNYQVKEIHQHWVITGGDVSTILPELVQDTVVNRTEQFALAEWR
jgi:hypothetical protein